MAKHHLINALALKTIPMFSGLSDEAIQPLLKMLRHRHVGRGEVIVREGDDADCFYLILAGKAKVILKNENEREFIISFLKSGEFFGEMAMLDQQPRSATVVAVMPCELLLVGKADFEQFLSGNYEIARYMLRSFAHRMRTAIRKIESLTMLDVYGRVARELLENSEMIDDEMVYRYRISKQEFSEMLGASREMVSRVLKDLEDEGFVEKRNDRLVIHDIPIKAKK